MYQIFNDNDYNKCLNKIKNVTGQALHRLSIEPVPRQY